MNLKIGEREVGIHELASNLVLIETSFSGGDLDRFFHKDKYRYVSSTGDDIFSTEYDDSENDFPSMYITYTPGIPLSFYDNDGYVEIKPEICRLTLSDEGLFQLSTIYDDETIMMCIIYATLERANCNKFYFDLDYYTKVLDIIHTLWNDINE